MHFVILTHNGAVSDVSEWFARRHGQECRACRIVAVADEIDFMMWAEDPYVAGLDESGRHALLEPDDFDRSADDLIATLIAPHAALARRRSPLIFEGGNILVGDTFYLVGADHLLATWTWVSVHTKLQDPDSDQIQHAIRRDFLDPGRQVHFLGCNDFLMSDQSISTAVLDSHGHPMLVQEHIAICSPSNTLQPIFHLDMFVTLAGRDTENGKFRILVGDPKLAADVAGIDLPDHGQAKAFDEIAAKLAAHKDFCVIRNPLPYVFRDYDVDGSHFRWRYYASSNNAIVQDCEKAGRRVWLPSFGFDPWCELKATDAMNRAIWESLGYEVTMMPNCHELAENMGVLHCLKKFLNR